MNIEKPLRLIDGMDKGLKPCGAKDTLALMRKMIVAGWYMMTEHEQEKLYTKLCKQFVELASIAATNDPA